MKGIADYEFLERLRPGNHGQYYLALSPARLGPGDEFLAVKVLNRHATDNEFKRMAAELSAHAGLRHPRLVELIDAGHHDGLLYIAMRHYPDGALGHGPASEPHAVALAVADAAEAAHALHEIGVVHRDIKPSNILLAAGRGHLTDLGVANFVDADFTATGSSPVGAVGYADPVMLAGGAPGRASDIWSLGATLHVALTGRPVLGDLPDDNLADALLHAISATPIVDPGCGSYADLVRQCCDLDRSNRPTTAEDVAARIRRIES